MNRLAIAIIWFATGGPLLVGAGCGGPPTASVTGTVSYENEPIQEGTIRFFPLDQAASHGAGSGIVDGRYEIAAGKGLFAGEYTVAITAVRSTGREVQRIEVDPGESSTIAETIQYLPAHYTQPGHLKASLDAGQNLQDFSLTRNQQPF